MFSKWANTHRSVFASQCEVCEHFMRAYYTKYSIKTKCFVLKNILWKLIIGEGKISTL